MSPVTWDRHLLCHLPGPGYRSRHRLGSRPLVPPELIVTVRVGEDNGLVRFRIDDDGRGFDPRLARHGTGVQGMVDRLDAIGGSLEISSEPGRGTSVEGVVPIERT